MSIARAFTTRRKKSSVDMRNGGLDGLPQRSNTTAKGGISIRNKISAPVQLIHTTNMLSYNAPDLFPKPASATSTKSSSDESDSAPTTASTPPTSPDSPSPTAKRPSSPEPNHLSCYFTTPAAPPAPEAPTIPQRAPSHTKKSYEGLTRHRSASRLSEQSVRSVSTKASFTFSRSSSSSTATSASSHASVSHMPKPSVVAAVPSSPPVAAHKMEYSESHPFGHELAQVSELAEEYASSAKEDDASAKAVGLGVSVEQAKPRSAMEVEEMELLSRGLRKFSAEDYLAEISGLVSSIFAEAARPMAAVWI